MVRHGPKRREVSDGAALRSLRMAGCGQHNTGDGEEIEPRASRRLTHHHRLTAREVLEEVAEHTDPNLEPDHYGAGAVVDRLERRVAEMLGHEAAVFMPSGTMAQQIALRIWSDRVGIPHVAFHPLCHLELHERHAFRRIHGLDATLLGSRERPFTVDDLEALSEPVSTILFELPQREIGGQLPDWNDLSAMTAWARERNIRLHLDGARLWETQPFYDRSYAEIAGLFDSAYVSFYKILGGIAGAVLTGPPDLIEHARVWQRRHGGNLVHMYPLAVSAELGLDRHLPRIGDYHSKATEIAEILTELPGVSVSPDPPHTNMMHAFFTGDAQRLVAAAESIARDHDIELFRALSSTEVPNMHRWEITVGSNALEYTEDEIRAWFQALLANADG